LKIFLRQLIQEWETPEEAERKANPSNPRNLSAKKHGSLITDYEELHHKKFTDAEHMEFAGMGTDAVQARLDADKMKN